MNSSEYPTRRKTRASCSWDRCRAAEAMRRAYAHHAERMGASLIASWRAARAKRTP